MRRSGESVSHFERRMSKFLREPPRASLTAPPSGYLTPSPEQPYGLHYKDGGKQKAVVQDHQTVGVER